MGLSASWICARGVNRKDALDYLGLVETGKPVDDPCQVPFSCAERPDGWLTISTTDAGWLLPQKVKALSSGGLAVGCFLEDHVMVSGACAYNHGARLWWVTHEPETGPNNLESGGNLPPEFESLRKQALRERKKDPEVDFVFEVPVELTVLVCGYRADGDLPDYEFTELRPLRSAKKGLFGMIGSLFAR
jgi:hypothetical protein